MLISLCVSCDINASCITVIVLGLSEIFSFSLEIPLAAIRQRQDMGCDDAGLLWYENTEHETRPENKKIRLTFTVHMSSSEGASRTTVDRQFMSSFLSYKSYLELSWIT